MSSIDQFSTIINTSSPFLPVTWLRFVSQFLIHYDSQSVELHLISLQSNLVPCLIQTATSTLDPLK